MCTDSYKKRKRKKELPLSFVNHVGLYKKNIHKNPPHVELIFFCKLSSSSTPSRNSSRYKLETNNNSVHYNFVAPLSYNIIAAFWFCVNQSLLFRILVRQLNPFLVYLMSLIQCSILQSSPGKNFLSTEEEGVQDLEC